MAKHAYTSEDITLVDGTRVTLRPLVVAKLKKFMATWEKIGGAKTEEESLDVLTECAAWGLADELVRLEKVNSTFDANNELTDEYKEYLENTLDIDTIYRVLDVAGKIKLDDPKLIAAAEAAALATMEQPGTTSTS